MKDDVRTNSLFLSGRIRALYGTVLPWEMIAQMAQTERREEAWQMLRSASREAGGVQDAARVLEGEKAALFRSLAQGDEGRQSVELMQIPYDCHNAKVLLKTDVLGKEIAENLLSPCGAVAAEVIEQAVRQEEYALLPLWLRRGILAGREAWQEGKSMLLLDMALERAAYCERVERASRSGLDSARQYVQILIDGANAGVLLRWKTTRPEVLEEALFPGGSVSPEALLEAYGEGQTVNFSERLLGTALAAGDAFRTESTVEQILNRCSKKWSMALSGGEAVLGFLVQLELRTGAVRMALDAVGRENAALRARLEGLYE